MPTRLGEGFRGPDGRIGYLLRQAHQAMRGAMEDALREIGLTAAQYSMLSIIEVEPGLSGAELATDAMLTAQSTNELSGTLERSGLIERRQDPHDGRIRRAYLTPQGKIVAASARTRVYQLEARMTAPLTARQLDDLKVSLVACATTLTQARDTNEAPSPQDGRLQHSRQRKQPHAH